MTKLPKQAKTVLAHLRAESHITAWQAEGVYRIRRLASRIDEIVAAGYVVLKEEAKDATGQRYIRYSLSVPQRRSHDPLNPVRPREARIAVSVIEREMLAMDFEPEDIAELLTNLKEKA